MVHFICTDSYHVVGITPDKTGRLDNTLPILVWFQICLAGFPSFPITSSRTPDREGPGEIISALSLLEVGCILNLPQIKCSKGHAILSAPDAAGRVRGVGENHLHVGWFE